MILYQHGSKPTLAPSDDRTAELLIVKMRPRYLLLKSRATVAFFSTKAGCYLRRRTLTIMPTPRSNKQETEGSGTLKVGESKITF